MYQNLQFPTNLTRPYYYINVVQTIDGKVQVKGDQKSYWPIGSKKDYETLIDLRAFADVLVHGKKTAKWVRTIDNLGKADFQQKRKKLGKTRDILYLVISANPDPELKNFLENPPVGVKPVLITTETSEIDEELFQAVNVQRFGKGAVDLNKLSTHLHDEGYKNILVEGGPNLWSSYFEKGMIDEMFVTIAPKVFGEKGGETFSLLSNYLFPARKIQTWKLLSIKEYEDEVYLRYRLEKGSK